MDTTLILFVAGAGALVLIIIGALMDSSSKKSDTQARAAATPKRSKSKLPAIVLGLIVLTVAAGAVYFVYLIEMEKREVRQKYGAFIADMCKDPAGIASASNLPTAAPPWKVVVLNDDGTRESWHNALPIERRATDQASTNVVACIKARQQVVSTCQFTTRSLDRIQYYADVTLMNAESGLPIAVFQVWGSMPRDCPELVTRNTGDLKGDDPAGTAGSKYYDTFYSELMQTVR